VKVLDGHLEQIRGVIGRYPDEGEKYAFTYDRVTERGIHMVFVRKPLQVEWWAGDELVASEILEPWTGYASHRADVVIESRPDRIQDSPIENERHRG